MDSNEQFVRATWIIGEFDLQCSHGGSWSFKEGHPLDVLGWFGWTDEAPDALASLWSAAADFTRAHLQKIADVEEEIDYVRSFVELRDRTPHPVWSRTLARLQAVRDDLKKGLK